MAIFENDICPVCGKMFEEGDDIVVCPECGTPHHRECYKELGKCANSALHKEGFVFERAASKKAEAEKQPEQQNAIPPFFVNIMADAQKQENADSAQQNADNRPQTPFMPPQLQGQEQYREIDGQPVSYIATTVGANARRFVEVFSKNKTLGWNWSALFFGPFYFLYRKMIREGLFLAAVEVVIRILVSIIFKDIVNAYNQGYSTIMQNLMQNSITRVEAADQLNTLINSTGYAKPMFIILALLAVVHIICALIADGVYKKRIISIVKEADAKLEQDAFFGVTPFMGQPEDARPEEIKRLYLSSRGGVSIFLPMCVYFLISFLLML